MSAAVPNISPLFVLDLIDKNLSKKIRNTLTNPQSLVKLRMPHCRLSPKIPQRARNKYKLLR